jgi:hypothetical protein
MAASVPCHEPKTLTAGDRWQWTRALSDYSASDGYTAVYDVVGAAGRPFQIATTGSGTTYTVDAVGDVTLPAGLYAWALRVVDSTSKRTTVDRGTFTVEADTVSVGGDEALLAAIDARIAGRALASGADIASYTIGNRSVAKIPLAELTQLRGIVAARVWRQRNPGQACPQIAGAFRAPR